MEGRERAVVGEAMPDEVAARQRRLSPGVDAVLFEVARSGMVEVEATRHPLPRRALELVPLPLESFDHPVERTASAIVNHRFAIPLEQPRLGHVQPDSEDQALRAQVEPVTRCPFLLTALPPPECL